MFLHFYRDFTEDDDMTEFPYPTKDLTGGEVLCMKDVAKELGLEVEQREQVCPASRQFKLLPFSKRGVCLRISFSKNPQKIPFGNL